jgi:predicted ABC-type ATPase
VKSEHDSSRIPQLVVLRGTLGSGKSSVAAQIVSKMPTFRVVEVDAIKKHNHGTAARCEAKDFVQAGLEAKNMLHRGHDTILVEAFVDQEHLLCALGATGRDEQSSSVHIVWLNCDCQTALLRKGNRLKDTIIRRQYKRYKTRYRSPNERCISSVGRTIEDVVEEVRSALVR